MTNLSLQIQSVLYGNEPESLLRALRSVQRAVQICRSMGGAFSQVTLCYGDASPARLFDEEQVQQISRKFEDAFYFSYRFFGFNSGTAKGHNLLGENCSSDYMVIMNPDVLLCPRFFLEIMGPFYRPELNAGLVEARQTPIEHPKEYDPKTGETGWASTACVIFSADLFRQLQGFDEKSFFLYCDDLDFSWRLRLLGKKIIYQPLAPVFHAKSLSSKGEWQPSGAEIYYSAEAALMVAHKWSNPKRVELLLKDFTASGKSPYAKAANAFMDRRQRGDLPEPVDPKHKVASFVGDAYAKHRFVL